jgi:hypothetical protein
MSLFKWIQDQFLPTPVALLPDGPDDVALLRRICTDLNRERRALKIERDCLKAELLRTGKHTEKSLAMRVKMYDRALRARVKATRVAS